MCFFTFPNKSYIFSSKRFGELLDHRGSDGKVSDFHAGRYDIMKEIYLGFPQCLQANLRVKVKQSRYRPGVAQRVPGS
jgi:hypothetical protein